MIHFKPLCDDDLLREMLRTDSDSQCDSSLLEHVETCSRCQHRLDELAADGFEWTRAVNVLSSNARAATGEQSPVSTELRAVTWTESMAKELLSPPTHPEMLGRIGRYDVERLIGSGGMGVVFRAHDTELNRAVAIKLLAPYLAASGTARNRFAREARAAAGVVDDHVVPIFNVESEGEPPFLVMQYVAGGSLQENLDLRGPLDVAEVVRIGLQVAKGLAAAHAQGLIHRDVKPSNILLDEGVERAMLTDFGLARTESDACLTRSGFHPGTPHYMSPEQVRGESLDARSDLFGLGCVLYAACTGHPPFRAESSYAVLRRITDDSPRHVREINANIPDWLERIIMKLLAKDRDERFESAIEVAELLEACLAHVQQPSVIPLPQVVGAATSSIGRSRTLVAWGLVSLSNTPAGRAPIRKCLLAFAFALPLLMLGIFITIETSKGTTSASEFGDDVQVSAAKPNTTATKPRNGSEAGDVVIPEDARDKRVEPLTGHLPVLDHSSGMLLYARGGTVLVTTFGGLKSNGFGERVGDPRRGIVSLLSVTTGKKVAEIDTGAKTCHSDEHIAVSRDGSKLAIAEGDQFLAVWDISSNDKLKQPLWRVDLRANPKLQHFAKYPAFSADGSKLAVRHTQHPSYPPRAKRHTLNLYDATTGSQIADVKMDGLYGRIAFFPDGRSLVTCVRNTRGIVMLKQFNSKSLEPMSSVALGRMSPFIVTKSDNMRVVFGGMQSGVIGIANLKTRKVRSIARQDRSRTENTFGDYSISSLAVSPDGRLIATGGQTFKPTIRVWDGSSGRLLKTLQHPAGHGGVLGMDFSLDGSHLATGARADGSGVGARMVWETQDIRSKDYQHSPLPHRKRKLSSD